MKQYKYFSKGFNCEVTVCYLEGMLCAVVIDKVKPIQVDRAFFYTSESAFLKSCNEHKVKVTEVAREITFDMFWDRYKYKVDKPLAIEQWDKLSREDQVRAYDFIPAYEAQLKLNGGLAKKYAVRYLKHKPWVQ